MESGTRNIRTQYARLELRPIYRKEDWAYINGHTIKSNFKKGPVWDTDQFTTNLFSHPYHGSLYFNAARSNGMNFWQSAPFAAGGSLMWEFFMENEPPSINDMLATTFGGIELGEITYRLSDLFIDNRSSGAERVGREVLAGILSPVRAFNRIIQEKPGDTVLQKDEPTLPFPSILSSRWDLVSSQNKKVRNGERPV